MDGPSYSYIYFKVNFLTDLSNLTEEEEETQTEAPQLWNRSQSARKKYDVA